MNTNTHPPTRPGKLRLREVDRRDDRRGRPRHQRMFRQLPSQLPDLPKRSRSRRHCSELYDQRARSTTTLAKIDHDLRASGHIARRHQDRLDP